MKIAISFEFILDVSILDKKGLDFNFASSSK